MTDGERSRIVVAIMSLGASEVARRLGLSREATLGLAVPGAAHTATEALAVARLGRLDGADDVA